MSIEKLEYEIALGDEAETRSCSARLLRLRDNVRELPQALAQYVRATKQGETTRDRVCLDLYHSMPRARRMVTLETLS